MTEKRFVGLFQGDMLVSVKDTQTNDRVNIIQIIAIANELNEDNERLKEYNNKLMTQPLLFDVQTIPNTMEIMEANTQLEEENEQLKSENKRLTDKLNKTALELVDECISQGKATEISEMSYRDFLHYRAENGKPMELQL